MKQIKDLIYWTGGILLIVGACLIITGWKGAPWLYLVGAVLFAAMQFTERYKGTNFVVKRLFIQQKIGALLLVVTGVTMFLLRHNDWVVFLTVAVLLELYTSFRIPQELKKEEPTQE